MDLAYIGGSKSTRGKSRILDKEQGKAYGLKNIRSAKIGLAPMTKRTKEQLLGGFQAPVPASINAITYVGQGKPKKQTQFKRIEGTPVAKLGKVVDKLIKDIGAPVGDTMTQINAKIAKERTKFRSNVNKAGTQMKKGERHGGATQKVAKDAATRLKDAFKADLKKLTAQHTLMALKEFNNKLH